VETNETVFVAGHRGLVGGAIVRRLHAAGHSNILTRSRSELDLTNQLAVDEFFMACRPQFVFLAAAKVGGIHANATFPAEFIRDNLVIQANVIHSAWRSGVRKLAFLGSSCIYPKFAPQPMQESSLLTGSLEPTNEWYAIAKIAGIKQCQAYRQQYGFDAISLMPTNLYGPGDNFDLQNSHVLPALIRKFHEAKEAGSPSVKLWGSGTPRREFLYVDDLADAAVYLMNGYSGEEIINVGVGEDQTIADLALLIKEIVGFDGVIEYDSSKPDGTPRKLLDVSRINGLGWQAETSLRDGAEATYRWFREHRQEVRA
jgi:GDP-L-fucose synthase